MSLAIASGGVVTIRRQRRLPIPGQVLVEVGQAVQPDSVVASAELPGAQIPVNVAYRLSIDPEYLPRYMRKQVGDPVQAGEALAVSSGLFHLVKETVSAPRTGVIESIDSRSGLVVIREPSIKVQRRAYLAGSVVEVLPLEGVTVEAKVQAWYGAFGVGGERYGRLLVACERPEQVLTADRITPAARGAILLAGASVPLESLQHASRVGVAGIITGGIQSEALSTYLGYELGVPITGQEEVATSLIVTEGFGDTPMRSVLHAALRACAGRVISLDGTTHLRSQHLRPEILIPVACEQD